MTNLPSSPRKKTTSSLSHTSSRQLLARIFEQPGLVPLIQGLDARILGKLIAHIGLEDSGEIVALATPAQLTKIFDEDLWKTSKPGEAETFNPARFGLWLEILLETGPELAARKVAELAEEDEDLLMLGLSRSILVVDLEEMARNRYNRFHSEEDDEPDLVDKALGSVLCEEFDQYRVIARNDEGWDAVVSLLLALDGVSPGLLRAILERCCAISNEYIEDNGGLYEVLTSGETLELDASDARERRREAEGFVAPQAAASFLALARVTALDELSRTEAVDPIVRSHFKAFARKQEMERVSAPSLETRELLDLLQAAEVFATDAESSAATALLSAPDPSILNAEMPSIPERLAELRSQDPELHSQRMTELNFLANTLVSGCSLEGRRFRPLEAANAVLATCSLGLEHLESDGVDTRALDVIRFFRVGWHLLRQEISLPAARKLAAALSELKPRGPWEQEQLEDLRRNLKRALREGKPWEVWDQFEPLKVILDEAEAKAWMRLLSECPILEPEAETKLRFHSSRAQIEESLNAPERIGTHSTRWSRKS